MIYLKPGVSLDLLTPQALFAMTVLDQVMGDTVRMNTTITSVGQEQSERDGGPPVHGPGSLHYWGRAFDFRKRPMTSAELNEVLSELRKRLGGDKCEYDLLAETDHGHVEWDPDYLKRGTGGPVRTA